MIIDEIREKRRIFNADVEKLIRKFELEIGITIREIKVDRLEYVPGSHIIVITNLML